MSPEGKLRRLLTRDAVLPIALLLIAAVCYLPLARQFGFYNDDWYLMYSGTALGSGQFMKVFESDRPFRGYFVGLMFDLFGTNALLYTFSAFALRLTGAFAFGWALRMAWPRQKMAAWLAALLFVIYPGFLDQPNAIDYQSHQMALALYMLSIALTVKAVLSPRREVKAGLGLLAVLFQVAALLLMEYYIGLEGLRLLLVGVVAPGGAGRAARAALPALAGAAGFLAWRLAFFSGAREATDMGSIFGSLSGSPLRLAWLLVNQARDLLNVVLFAWAVPVYDLTFQLRLKEIAAALALAAASALGVGLLVWLRQPEPREATEPVERDDALAMVAVGLLAAAAALVPAHLGDRHVIFHDFGRFSLPPAAGAAVLLAGVWLAVLRRRGVWRAAFPALLVALAVMTHYANSARAAENWRIVRGFWWQVSWRVPQIEPGTVLMTDYAGKGTAEDYLVWGPANLIYYPSLPDAAGQPELPLYAGTLNRQDVQHALDGALHPFSRRGLRAEGDYSRLLVMTMPDANSCVRVFDGENPELSVKDRADILLLAPYSDMELVQVDARPGTPPAAIFGSEPDHGWCYYYQKASLARQQGDWEGVVRLGREALAKGLSSNDAVEWLPFLQGFAVLGHLDELQPVIADVSAKDFTRRQLCAAVEKNAYGLSAQSPAGQALMEAVDCERP